MTKDKFNKMSISEIQERLGRGEFLSIPAMEDRLITFIRKSARLTIVHFEGGYIRKFLCMTNELPIIQHKFKVIK